MPDAIISFVAILDADTFPVETAVLMYTLVRQNYPTHFLRQKIRDQLEWWPELSLLELLERPAGLPIERCILDLFGTLCGPQPPPSPPRALPTQT